MKTKKQDNTIITEEEKIVGQDQGGGVTERKDISTTKATNTPSPEVDDGTLDEDNFYMENIPPKVDVTPAPKVESKTPAFDMQTMINDLNAREEEALKQNEEERKKESRYHRARSIISAIGDGLSGLANIYYTTKGAPDMLKGTTSMNAKQQERWDKIRKEREARREAYLKAVRDNNRESLKNAYTQWKDNLEAKRIEEELELKEASEARQRAKLEFDQAIAKAKEERDKELHSLDVKAKDYEVKKAEIEARYIEKEKQANLRLKAAQTASANRANRDNKSNEKEDYILVSQDDGQGNRLSRKVYKNDPDYIQYKNQFAQDGWSALD